MDTLRTTTLIFTACSMWVIAGCPSAEPPSRPDAGAPYDGSVVDASRTDARADDAANIDAAVNIDAGEDDAAIAENDASVPDGSPGDATTSSDGGPESDAGPADGSITPAPRERSQETTLSYGPTHTGASVFVAGTFNQWSPTATPLTDPDGDGVYTTSLSLSPGLYPYKLVVDGSWMLDPSHNYRAYEGGTENSGLRVPDATRPLLRLVDQRLDVAGAGRGKARFVIAYDEGFRGPGPAADQFVVKHQNGAGEVQTLARDVEWRWDPATWGLTVDLSGLQDGKHTVTVEGVNENGQSTETLRLPFWVEPESFDWRDAFIYMILTDRFQNGDQTNDSAPYTGVASNAQYEGGDLDGVTQAIEDGYFDRMGVTALWLTPFNRGPDTPPEGESGRRSTGYHGYWPVEPRQVDPRIGGEAALKRMVAAAHQRGIRILMDFVINHVYETHAYVPLHPDWFGTYPSRCVFATPGCDWTEHRLDGIFSTYMPDVVWENKDTSEQFISDALWWLETFDLDGLRVDAVKHVPDGAVFNLGIRIAETLETDGLNVFLTGETAMGWNDCDPNDPGCNSDNYGTIGRYLGPKALDGQFDFVLHHAAAFKVFAEESRNLIHAAVWTQASIDHFGGATMTPFISSHDTPRFISAITAPETLGNQWPDQNLASRPGQDRADAYARLGLAETWNLTIPGAPMLYYGDEYGEYGSRDPDNRHRMRFANDRNDNEANLFTWISAVGRARKDLRALRRGELITLKAAPDFWAYARLDNDTQQIAVVALNRSRSTVTETLTLPAAAQISAGTELQNRLGSERVRVDGEQMITVTLPGLSAQILAP
ncbi:MAG: glycosyl hydrolase [Deltaproteobacteria bacterium]|nr:glycosyl hydrolase [Deltaproteobacteria bacterium]